MSSGNRMIKRMVKCLAWSGVFALLLSCGGGAGSGSASAPGTGGTGVYAQGSIAGFGSVIVNGVKYDDSAATVRMDGVTVTSADLRLGMVASISGTRSTDVTIGTAKAIEVWSIAQGTVTQVSAGQFVMMGTAFSTDAATSYSGVTSTTLSVGSHVAVWGLLAKADGSVWSATRVASNTQTLSILSGQVTVVGTQRSINGVILAGATAAGLNAGQMVRVQGTYDVALNTLTLLDSSQTWGGAATGTDGDGAEVEGVITNPLAGNLLKVGTLNVDISTAKNLSSTATLTVGTRVEVSGVWKSGVLMASQIGMEDEESQSQVEIEAPIQTFTSIANFVVRAQVCDATGITPTGGKLSDLKVGTKVHIKGAKVGDTVKVTSLQIDM